MSEALPLTLLTGFLGAGKTTLLNRVLTERAETRFAVIVNEFGDVGVDGDLVVGATERLVQLANGCVCCTVRGDLQAALLELLEARERRLLGRRDFDRVIVEASGLAAPGPIVQTLAADPRLASALRLDAVVCMAHARNLPRQLEDFPEAEEQVAYADVLVLNHADRASAQELEDAREAARRRNAAAVLHEARHARVDLVALLEVRTTADSSWALDEVRPHAHGHASGVGTVALTSSEPLDLDTLKIWLQFLATRRGQDLYRLKGILACRGRTERVVVQGMYEWLELGPSEEPAPATSSLVLIGKDLDREELDRGWRAAGGVPPEAAQAERE